jgi:pyruvate dehydrogenase E2 component (dihydrolipoamide acetyltransferase)
MSTEIRLPELGENIEKGDVVRVLVAPGDSIRPDQPLIELETDKATIEVPSATGGTVLDIAVKAGDKVRVGQVLMRVDTGATGARGATGATGPTGTTGTAGTAGAAAVLMPLAGAPPVGAGPSPASVAVVPRAAGPVAAPPSVRRYARELGVAIADVAGTGPGGRISRDDVTAHVKRVMTAGGPAGPGGARRLPLPDFAKWGPIDVRPMTNIRRKTAEHLTAAWQAPHVTNHDRADVGAVDEFRKAHGARVEAEGGKLTVTAIVIKILALAIGKYPQFAASVDMEREAIVFKQYCHIGVAVDTPNGLLVPVIRHADRKTITQIAIDLAVLSQKARDRKLGLDEMAGGVFSVTNLGGIGGTSFTPIVNQPEVAILGLSRTSIEPVWQNGQFVPRPMLPLSLSYDHRVIDGADAARFLRFVADALEQPLSVYL